MRSPSILVPLMICVAISVLPFVATKIPGARVIQSVPVEHARICDLPCGNQTCHVLCYSSGSLL